MHTPSHAKNRTRAIVIAALAAAGLAGSGGPRRDFERYQRRQTPVRVGTTMDRARTSCTF
jgi:hypothetical protein